MFGAGDLQQAMAPPIANSRMIGCMGSSRGWTEPEKNAVSEGELRWRQLPAGAVAGWIHLCGEPRISSHLQQYGHGAAFDRSKKGPYAGTS